MAQAAPRHMIFSLALAGLLMGCVDGAGSGAGAPKALPASDRSGASKSGTGRDVEAPEVFQTTDTALWDGRPSLGGIWVASPNAKDPERVVMFNPTTGKSVNGALFRRERDNPGPTLQMSSDAAEALGMLAGQPAQIRVTALRREEVKATVASAPADAPADPATTGTDVAATAAATTAALAATGAGRAAAKPETAPASDPVSGTTTRPEARPAAMTDSAALPEGEASVAPVAEKPPANKTWKERRAEAKAAREAKKAAAAAAAASKKAEPVATAESAGVASVETAPLDASAPAEVATQAPAKAETAKTRRQKRAEAEAAAAAASAAAEAEAPAAPAASGRQIQVASFSQEQNAIRAVEALAKVGVSAQPRKSETNGKVVWGVVALGDQNTLTAIKAAGFADAYFLK